MTGSDLVLGIESSCDETAAAVVRAGREIVSSVVASQDARHAPFGGIVPEIASRAHTEVISRVVERALQRAEVGPRDLRGIAVANRPGLLGSLLVGLTAAKALAWAWDLPLVAVHHLEAHLYGATWAEGIEEPFVGLVASGGHTSLYLCASTLDVRRIGATTDDAAGEAFDKIATLLGLGYPGGPAIERAARGVNPGPLRFPRSRMKGRPFDFTFLGLKTAVLYHVRRDTPWRRAPEAADEFPRVAAAFQEAAVDMLVGPTVAAARETGARAVTATGGVAANSRLRESLEHEAKGAGLACAFPPRELCTDNAAMVAGRGWHDLARGASDALDIDANARPERAPYGDAPSGGGLREEAKDMNSDRLREVLEDLARGGRTVESALEALRGPYVEDMGFARVDLHRGVRCGFPEVVFCEGKTCEQARKIARVLFDKCGRVLATRASDEVRAELAAEFEGCEFEENAVARAVLVGGVRERKTAGEIAVVSAGTGDIPVAEEAAFTARAMGSPVKTLYDVGVAGIHRLLDARGDIQRANVVIVVAGMEGALASVVGGLVDRPVIGVPTSIGYGASFGGAAALLAMLNSCAAGVSVVNIDNGFGAGYVAALINESREPREG